MLVAGLVGYRQLPPHMLIAFVICRVISFCYCVAGVRSRSVASAWPRSGRALGLLLGRGQVVLCGFCLAEFISCCLVSASPRSGLRPWLLQLLLCRARCLRVLQVRGRVLCSSSFWCLFSVQFFFSCPLRKWHPCRLGAWLISLLQP